MKSTSFTLISILVVGVLLGGGYVAIKSLKNPHTYLVETKTRIGDLHNIETDPQTTLPEPVVPTPVPEVSVDPKPVSTSTTSPLETAIQKLIDDKATLKKGDKGPSVGTMQTFMNAYFKKTLRVDNDFGPTLEANVKAFQKATGVTQTGQVGPATLGKMIDWLDKNPQ